MNLSKFCVEKIQEWKLAVLQKKKINSAFVLEPIFPDFGHIWLSFLGFQWSLSFSADKHSKEGSSEDWTNKNTQSKWYSRSWEREIAVNSARNGDYISGFAQKLVAESKFPPPRNKLIYHPKPTDAGSNLNQPQKFMIFNNGVHHAHRNHTFMTSSHGGTNVINVWSQSPS